MPKVDWVGDGDKFALIGLDVNLDRSFDVLKIDESATAVAGGQFTLPEHWQEWLGTIRVEEVQGCTLFMAIRATDKSSGVLDEQSQLLSNRVHDWCTGLILASDFVSMSGYAFIAGGSRSGDEVDIRQFGPIKAPARSVVNSMKPIARESLQRAWMISLSIGEFRNLPIQDTWRLSQCLRIYVGARSERNLLDRIHQFVRCIEGLVAPEQGKTKSQIKGRTELFIGPSHHDLIGGLFDIRSDVEHMHDYKHLSEYSREDRIEIATKEAVAEWVCRSCLERIILNPELVTAFGSMSALTEFWGGSQRERVIKWGQPFDPLAPIKDFNTDWVSDAELGARE